jgi:hypothetical protein
MKALNGYNEVKASTGEYARLPAGGYICKITKVEDVPAKEYLRISFDIYEGEYRGWYRDQREELEDRGYNASYIGTVIRSYKDSALGFFKAFIAAVDESNGTQLGPTVEGGLDEQKLVGCLIGFVISYEEYKKNNGSIGQRERVAYQKSIQKIRDGDFKVPDLKRLNGSNTAAASAGAQTAAQTFTDLDDDDTDLPFF